jgi:quercetin dioxygenase-like cupin family protein
MLAAVRMLAAVPMLAALSAAALCAQDAVQVSPGAFKVEIDNPWVRTLREKLAPHEKIALHQHPPSVVIYLSDTQERLTGPDNQSRDVAHKKDEVAYFGATSFAEENLSSQPLEQVVIELKPAANGHSSKPVALDPVKLDPEHHLVALENARVRAIRTILEPQLKSPMHEHPHYVVVYLTVLHTTMQMADGKLVDNPRQPGDIAWRDYLKHQTENIGDKRAVEIQVEIK